MCMGGCMRVWVWCGVCVRMYTCVFVYERMCGCMHACENESESIKTKIINKPVTHCDTGAAAENIVVLAVELDLSFFMFSTHLRARYIP